MHRTMAGAAGDNTAAFRGLASVLRPAIRRSDGGVPGGFQGGMGDRRGDRST
jgi:hypothetical protein